MPAIVKKFKMLQSRAMVDSLVSYFTDANAFWEGFKEWLASHHRKGAAFAASVVNAGGDVLAASAAAATEQSEAVEATTLQNDVFDNAVGTARNVRERGAYIASEIMEDDDGVTDEDKALAAKIRTCCGIGMRVNLKRQTGIRRLLEVQKTGLGEIASTMTDWQQPADLLQQVEHTLARITEAVQKQSKEQLEADNAQDQLELRVEAGVRIYNRALRLVNVERHNLPAELATGLSSLQADHPKVFYAAPEIDDGQEPGAA